jgi:hypothetical protein
MQPSQSLLYFKAPSNPRLSARCFGLTRASSGNCSSIGIAALHQFVAIACLVCAIACLGCAIASLGMNILFVPLYLNLAAH